jgi:hypothetical protein
MNKEQQELIDEVYEKYSIIAGMSTQTITLTRGWFIREIETNPKFSKTWGLKIEERELSSEEIYELADEKRWELVYNESNKDKVGTTDDIIKKYNIPTRLITITYNQKTITSYDNDTQ